MGVGIILLKKLLVNCSGLIVVRKWEIPNRHTSYCINLMSINIRVTMAMIGPLA
jgi:hypothetical protein